MALFESYGALKGELSQWLLHDVADKAATLIGFCEQELRADLRFLDGELPVTATGNGTNRFPLPVGYLGMRSLRILEPDDGYELVQVAISELRPYDESGNPTHYAIDRDLVFNVKHALKMEMIYLNRFMELSDTNPTNWVLANHPSAYFYGSLRHGGIWVRNQGIIATAEAEYNKIVAKLKVEDKSRRWSMGRKQSKPVLPVEIAI